MFTGIIEAIGEIEAVEAGAESGRVWIGVPAEFGPLALGESIAVDGACLTAEELRPEGFAASASAETLSRTTLGRKSTGDKVNLERALVLGGRLGGHWVAGHVDAKGRIRSWAARGNGWELAIEAPSEVLQLCVEKGCVAVDGISLTIAAVQAGGFVCAVIPHTFARTTLRFRQPGDEVNLESDLMGKYVQRLLGCPSVAARGVTWETLERTGFV